MSKNVISGVIYEGKILFKIFDEYGEQYEALKN